MRRLSANPREDAEAGPGATSRTFLISGFAAGIGVVAGFVAYLLYNLIALFTNLAFYRRVSLDLVEPRHADLGLWFVVIPVIGGLIIGLMARYGSPKIKGHGIPEAMEAVLVNRSRIGLRVAVLKPLSAAIAIGTGGPFGAEGPIIQTGGALGSLVGQAVHVTAAERKVLLACGAAAGMSATFNTPVASVILAIELLLFEFKARSFIPLVIASTLATSVHFWLLGQGPVFAVPPVEFGVPQGLPFFALLGLICGAGAVAFTRALYWVEDQFERLPLDEVWHPALGALALGVIGFFVPRVLGVGYDTITDILTDRLSLQILLLILVFKSLALLVSLGSGTSGGLLAPMFMSSAALGAVYAAAVNRLVPGVELAPGAYALVAMGAVFGAAARAPFTFIIFAFEVTQDYHSILPLMLTGVIAYAVGLVFLRNSIMTEKLARRGLRVPDGYDADVLQHVRVGEVMDRDVPTIPATMTVSELMDRIAMADPVVTRHQALPIVDGEGGLVGIITRGDLLHALEGLATDERSPTVLEAGSDSLIVGYPDEPLQDAVLRMLRNDIGRLPIVSREEPRRLVGYLGRSGVMAARLQRLRDEHVLEPGWLARRRAQPAGEGSLSHVS
ncbi:MAG TPA: chloride channel protein [Dehalococcoidia bacterium]